MVQHGVLNVYVHVSYYNNIPVRAVIGLLLGFGCGYHITSLDEPCVSGVVCEEDLQDPPQSRDQCHGNHKCVYKPREESTSGVYRIVGNFCEFCCFVATSEVSFADISRLGEQ